jgi:2-polyprenyl-3-methyl-5-hydroxy-6-metoxy-1,4-benzoquinol methylase
MNKINIKKWLKRKLSDDIVLLRKNTNKALTILDIGCGYNSNIQYCDSKYSIGVDNFIDYINKSKNKKIHNEYIQKDITELDFPEKFVDIVYCSEVIEHLNKEDGLRLIKNMEKWAKRKVIITTPNGFVEQEEYHNNPYQKHLSGWDYKNFISLGYKVYGMNGLKILAKISGKNILIGILYILSGKLFRFFPKYTFQIFAVKNITK